jgi:dihydrofolate reductase
VKTVLYVSLTANGYLAQADASQPIPSEILADFSQKVQRAGNLVIGRHAYDLFSKSGGLALLAGVTCVVVSHGPTDVRGACAVNSPRRALAFLEERGVDQALVGGGAGIDSSFLAEGLVDEMYVNLEPSISKAGLNIRGALAQMKLRLQDINRISNDIVQLRYEVVRDAVATHGVDQV